MTQQQKGYVGLGVMILLAGAAVFGSSPLYEALDKLAAQSISYTPGSYTGSADGFGGKILATVTISDKGMESVVLKGKDETPSIGGVALENMGRKFIEAQSSRVDTISGSTVTCRAAMAAVQEALDQGSGKLAVIPLMETEEETAAVPETEAAVKKVEDVRTFQPGTYTGAAKGYGGEVTVTVVITDQGIQSVKLTGDDETEEIGQAALNKLSKKFVEVQTSVVDAISGCTITCNAAMVAMEQALEQAAYDGALAGDTQEVRYIPGTYNGIGKGYGGDVTASVVIGENGIESVKLVGDDETEEIGGEALDKLEDRFVKAQNARVDAISGSTITSDAAVDAVQQALDQAVS